MTTQVSDSPRATIAVVVGMSGATGLGVVRALAHAGVVCHAVHSDAKAPGLFSRLARAHLSPDWRADREAFLSSLLALASDELGGEAASLFVTDDAAIEVVWSAADRLRAAGLRPAFSFSGAPAEALDKRTQMSAAARAGVDHPAGEWGAAQVLLDRVDSFRYPVIVKPALSHVGVRQIGAKALPCATAAELVEALERTRGLDVLVQEFVPGGDDQLYTCGVFRGAGRALVFTGRKLKQHPPVLGISRLSEAVAVPEIVPGSVRLLDELGYQGVAQVEYKRDARDGVYRLMEVNVRPWTWIGLAEPCGVNLPLAAHEWALAAGEPGPPAAPALAQREGRWIWSLPEAIHTARDLSHGRPPDVRLWRGLRAEAFFSRDDPQPFLELAAPALRRVEHPAELWLQTKRGVLRGLRQPALVVNLGLALGDELHARRARPRLPRPARGLPGGGRVLVLAPHPDDETIMCGATLAASRRRGDAVRVVAVTSGAATGQGAGGDVSGARRSELRRAAESSASTTPSSGSSPTAASRPPAEKPPSASGGFDAFAPTDIYVPFPHDAHDDHVATALALGDALGRRDGPTAGELWVHGGFVSTAPDPLWVDRIVPAAGADWNAKLRAVRAYGSRDEASVFLKPLQLALLAPGNLLRPGRTVRRPRGSRVRGALRSAGRRGSDATGRSGRQPSVVRCAGAGPGRRSAPADRRPARRPAVGGRGDSAGFAAAVERCDSACRTLAGPPGAAPQRARSGRPSGGPNTRSSRRQCQIARTVKPHERAITMSRICCRMPIGCRANSRRPPAVETTIR